MITEHQTNKLSFIFKKRYYRYIFSDIFLLLPSKHLSVHHRRSKPVHALLPAGHMFQLSLPLAMKQQMRTNIHSVCVCGCYWRSRTWYGKINTYKPYNTSLLHRAMWWRIKNIAQHLGKCIYTHCICEKNRLLMTAPLKEVMDYYFRQVWKFLIFLHSVIYIV